MISKKQWVMLAEAYEKEYLYEREVGDAIEKIAEKFGVDSDFLGNTINTDIIFGAVEKVLGDEWSYYFYDCERSFDEYNEGVTYEDGTHPNVHSLDELYDESVKEGALE